MFLVSLVLVLISLKAGGGGLEPTDPSPQFMLSGSFDCFLKIDGVPGESTDEKHKEWIELLSYSHGVSQAFTLKAASGGLEPTAPPGPTMHTLDDIYYLLITGSTSSGGERTAERCEHQDFSVVKSLDKTSPILNLYCCNGTHITEVIIELCRPTEDKLRFMKYRLEDAMVTAVRPGGSAQGAEGRPLEEVSFNYKKIEWTYTETDPKTGYPMGDISTYWDLEANKGG